MFSSTRCAVVRLRLRLMSSSRGVALLHVDEVAGVAVLGGFVYESPLGFFAGVCSVDEDG